MQVLIWIFRFAIVLVLVWFAVRNSGQVTLNGLPGQEWKVSLVFVLLMAFVAGVVIGLLAWLPTVVRQRREISRLRRAADAMALGNANPPPADPPRVDVHGI